MESSQTWIEGFLVATLSIALCIVLVQLSRAMFWLRNRLAKRFRFSKAEATFMILAPILLLVLWRMYAWPMD